MVAYKKLVVISSLALAVVISIAASSPPAEPKRNLKVLPKNISAEDLDKVMDNFKDALGVKCNFCHAPQKDDPNKMDFASDAKPEKEIARDMMRMTTKINKKYFNVKPGKDKEALPPVTCATCHHGKPHPENK
ncbi:MAG: c-type cytochrome [Chitinophagaceae bacterium]|nr:c-type cytochrome [Chitinophagaceae bacterium]